MNELHPKTVEYILRSEPRKRVLLGQFFAPESLRRELISKIPRHYKPRALDLARGTGEFLLTAREYFIEPELYCWEIDPELAHITKEGVPKAKVEVVDSLTKPFTEEFNVVLGNPPYYEFRPSRYVRRKFKEVIHGRVNTYSLFMYLGLKLLKPNGYLAFVVSSSMNNGAYFRKLREFIVRNADIEHLKVLSDPYIFSDPRYRVSHAFQLIVLRKTRNSGKYIFRYNDILIFSEKSDLLKEVFRNSVTLKELGYRIMAGKVVWNQHRDKLTDNPREGILLIWTHNIRHGRLVLGNSKKKPPYIKWPIEKADRGPAIVITRVTGHPKRAVLRAALVPPDTIFVAENHVNVVYPPPNATIEEMKEIVRQPNSERINRVIREITGNIQITKTELENLIPIRLPRTRVLLRQ